MATKKIIKTQVSGIENVDNTSDISKPVSTAQQAAINTAINNIQIGGVNLLRNSNKFKVGSSDAPGVVSTVQPDGTLEIDVTQTGTYLTGFIVSPSLNDTLINEGENITISYWIRSPDATAPFRFYLKPGMGYYDGGGNIGADYTQIYLTVPYRKANNLAIHVIPTQVGTYYLKCLQIEKGNKASDWSPAPEDIQAQLQVVNDIVGNIQIGGVNLVTDAKYQNPIASNGSFIVGQPDKDGGNTGIRYTVTPEQYNYLRFREVVPSNGLYTMSFYARNVNTGAISIRPEICDQPADYVITISEEWTYVKLEGVQINNYSPDTYNFIDIHLLNEGSIDISFLKLERGNKATDWTPALSDILAQMQALSDRIAALGG